MSEYIDIPSHDGGSFKAFVAFPEKLPAPTVVVAQEIFGINDVMRDICEGLADQGYIGACPDLFWRLEPGVELSDKSEEEWAKAFELFNKFDVDTGVLDLRSTEHTFKGHAHCTGRVGTVGFCLGGKMAYLLASRTNIDVAVSYYGVGLDELLNESQNILQPLMLHIAEEDKFVSKEAQDKIKTHMQGHPHVVIHSYPGADHAFARVGGEHYDAEAANLANGRTLDFLKTHLGLTD